MRGNIHNHNKGICYNNHKGIHNFYNKGICYNNDKGIHYDNKGVCYNNYKGIYDNNRRSDFYNNNRKDNRFRDFRNNNYKGNGIRTRRIRYASPYLRPYAWPRNNLHRPSLPDILSGRLTGTGVPIVQTCYPV